MPRERHGGRLDRVAGRIGYGCGCGWTSSYDGTDFSGWAAQPGRRTVAGVLVEALAPAASAPGRSPG